MRYLTICIVAAAVGLTAAAVPAKDPSVSLTFSGTGMTATYTGFDAAAAYPDITAPRGETDTEKTTSYTTAFAVVALVIILAIAMFSSSSDCCSSGRSGNQHQPLQHDIHVVPVPGFDKKLRFTKLQTARKQVTSV